MKMTKSMSSAGMNAGHGQIQTASRRRLGIQADQNIARGQSTRSASLTGVKVLNVWSNRLASGQIVLKLLALNSLQIGNAPPQTNLVKVISSGSVFQSAAFQAVKNFDRFSRVAGLSRRATRCFLASFFDILLSRGIGDDVGQ
jgi:hypothetical protein